MPTPALLSADPIVLPDGVSGDPISAFTIKSEESASPFTTFIPSPEPLTPSPPGLHPLQNHFDSTAPHLHASGPPPPSLMPGRSTLLSSIDMDVLESATNGGSSNMYLSFSNSTPQPLGQSSDDMQGVTSIGSPDSVNTSSSSAASLAASPALPTFANISTSSLASALDEHRPSLLPRSRSGSLVSPSASLQGPSFPRTSPPRTTREVAAVVSALVGGATTNGHSSLELPGLPRPDPATQPHLSVVDNMLTDIAKAALTARAACSLGQGAAATTKIDEMKHRIALVANLLAKTMLELPSEISDGSHSNGSTPGASNQVQTTMPSHRSTQSLPSVALAQSPGLLGAFPPSPLGALPASTTLEQAMSANSNSTSASSHSGLSPESDSTRKRGASSITGNPPANRSNKSQRLGPMEGTMHPPLQGQQTSSPSPPALSNVIVNAQPQRMMIGLPSGVLQQQQMMLGGINDSVAPISAPLPAGIPLIKNSPSAPPSRPNSPLLPGWSILPMSGAVPVASAPVPLSAVNPVTQPHPPFRTLHPLTTSGLGSSVPAIPSPTKPMSGWAEPPGAGAMMGGVLPPLGMDVGGPGALPGIAAITGSSLASYGAPAPQYVSPSRLSQGQTASTSSARPTRSSSLSGPLVFGSGEMSSSEFVPSHSRARASSRPNVSTAIERRSRSASSEDDDSDHEYDGYILGGYGHHNGSGLMHSKWSPPLKSRDSSRERPSQRQRINGGSGQQGEGQSGAGGSGGHGNEIPAEYRAEVDRVFFDFMNKICSNLDATDTKGEPIHQTLMAKKMQRLDESPDFRPFKFRIQAFTNGFLEELARQGYPEEKIAMKKVRNYLWNQPYISRFNEDGKKAKSKGNHIWNIDARKKPEGGWEFRPFHRKLAGQPPPVAYAGLRWSWSPRVWDPQAARANMPVQFNSPSLPPWLAWDDKGTLSGIPPQDAQNCDVTVEARFNQDGRDEVLTQMIHISVSPMQSGTDSSFSARPALTGDIHNARRVNSDPVVPLSTGAPVRALQPAPPQMCQNTQLTTQDAQMMQVLTSAAQRVAEEAQAHVIAASHSIHPGQDPGPELQALAKQQHVLTMTAQALDEEVSSPHPQSVSPSSHALVAVAQQVVFQAARQVATDRSIAAVMGNQASAGQVTVNEVSVATQEAVAEAVNLTGPLSSEVDVLMTASSLLHQKTFDPLPTMSNGALGQTAMPPNGPQSAPMLPSYNNESSMPVAGMDLNYLPS